MLWKDLLAVLQTWEDNDLNKPVLIGFLENETEESFSHTPFIFEEAKLDGQDGKIFIRPYYTGKATDRKRDIAAIGVREALENYLRDHMDDVGYRCTCLENPCVVNGGTRTYRKCDGCKAAEYLGFDLVDIKDLVWRED